MELSARNQLPGIVRSVAIDGLMAEVVVDIGGHDVVSVVTRRSAERLGMVAGKAVIVVVKATEVLLATD